MEKPLFLFVTSGVIVLFAQNVEFRDGCPLEAVGFSYCSKSDVAPDLSVEDNLLFTASVGECPCGGWSAPLKWIVADIEFILTDTAVYATILPGQVPESVNIVCGPQVDLDLVG